MSELDIQVGNVLVFFGMLKFVKLEVISGNGMQIPAKAGICQLFCLIDKMRHVTSNVIAN
jgi:hypothetical protein